MNMPIGSPRPRPRPTLTPARLRLAAHRGWSWGRDYVWILRALARGLVRRDLPARYADGDGRPVLLLPGVYEEWTVMRHVADRLNKAGHPIHVLPDLGRNTIGIIDAARLAEAYLVAHDLRDVVIVAHSKGGLIGKQLLASGGTAADRVRRIVAVATPFAGSRLAPLVPTQVVRSLGPDDETIVALVARADLNEKIVSICPSFDPHIPGGSFLDGATNVAVEAMGHFRVLADPAVVNAVVSAAAL